MSVVQLRCAGCEHHLRLRPEDVLVLPRTEGSPPRGRWSCPRCGRHEVTVLTEDARRALGDLRAGPAQLGVTVLSHDLPRQGMGSGVPDGTVGGRPVSGQFTHHLPGELLVGDDDHCFRTDLCSDPPGQ